MKKTTFAILLAMFVMVTATSADTLHLRSGANIGGDFFGCRYTSDQVSRA
jgi:hypothetical protein